MSTPFRVVVGNEAVACLEPSGAAHKILWSELGSVSIQTTDRRQSGKYFFWRLVDRSGRSIVVVPSDAEGCGAMIAALQELPGFDREQILRASQSTQRQTLLCWRGRIWGRPSSEQGP